MTRALTVTLALTLAAGCSVLLKPDRDAIVGDPDAGMGGMDGDVEDGGPDGGPDAGDVDGGCRAPQDFELDCANGMDDDCDELVDCRDFDCASSMRCCMLDGSGTPGVTASFGSGASWTRLPDETAGPTLTSTHVSFRASSEPTAVVLDECVELAYGTRIDGTFEVMGGGNDRHYGALVLGPTRALSAEGGLPADLAVIIDHMGNVRVERAGTMLGEVTSVGLGTTPFSISLSPGIDEAGRAVLRVSVEVDAASIVDDVPLMPLSDLRGPEAGCDDGDGLFLGLEGRGIDTVRFVDGGLDVRLFECENPSQFTRDIWLPDIAMELDPDDAWRTGGIGEPSLAHFRDAPLPGGQQLLEVWVDGADLERADEIFRPVEFAIGAARRNGPGWQARTAGGSQPLIVAAREPSIAVPTDADRVEVGDALIAYARAPVEDAGLGIGIRSVGYGTSATPGTEELGIEAGASLGCAGLRDPALVPLDETGTDFALFFTCEAADLETDRIGLAFVRKTGSASPPELASALFEDVVPTGARYARRGVFSPEVVAHRRADGTIALRMWYLARGDTGEVTLAFAYGNLSRAQAPRPDGGVDAGLDAGPPSGDWQVPEMAPFAGNPILRSDSPVLGSDSCALGCSIESVGVTSVLNGDPSYWTRPYYLVLVDRTRYDAGGVLHDLIPLLQIQPNDP